MAATIEYQSLATTGHLLTYAAADDTLDTLRVNDRGGLWVRNDKETDPVTVTIDTPGTGKYGGEKAQITKVIVAGDTVAFAPLHKDLANPTSGYVHVTMDDPADVSVAALQL